MRVFMLLWDAINGSKHLRELTIAQILLVLIAISGDLVLMLNIAFELNNIIRLILKQKEKRVESLTGVQYSILLDLKHFDIIRSSCIDPMNNLFLG